MSSRAVFDKYSHTLNEAITAVVAVASMAAATFGGVHYWLAWLSEEAALIMPILGAIFLVIQIYYKVVRGK